MSSVLFQLACWAYLPDFTTRQALSLIHPVLQRTFGKPPPAPRSPDYVRHYRYTYAGVVLCYLTYNFVHASNGIEPNFYQLLGVDPQSDEGALKAAFRAFARKNHPDRTGPEGEALFINVRDAYEALKDPVVRFAYDRFGRDVLRWQDCSTIKDYLRRGLLEWLIRHMMTGVGLFLFSVVGKRSPVAAWRYLLFVGMFGLELYLIVVPSSTSSGASTFVDDTRPSRTLLEHAFPQHVTYQHVLFLQQVLVFMSIAVSRVAPVLFAGMMGVDEETEAGVARGMGARIWEVSKGIEREVWQMVNGDVEAIQGKKELDEGVMEMMEREMVEMVVENKLKSEVPMQSAWDGAVTRRRARSKSL